MHCVLCVTVFTRRRITDWEYYVGIFFVNLRDLNADIVLSPSEWWTAEGPTRIKLICFRSLVEWEIVCWLYLSVGTIHYVTISSTDTRWPHKVSHHRINAIKTSPSCWIFFISVKEAQQYCKWLFDVRKVSFDPRYLT